MDRRRVIVDCVFFRPTGDPASNPGRHQSSADGEYLHYEPSIQWLKFLSPLHPPPLKKRKKKKKTYTLSSSKVIELEWEHHTFGLWWDIKRKVVSQGKLYWVFRRETALKFISVKMRRGNMVCEWEGRFGLHANIVPVNAASVKEPNYIFIFFSFFWGVVGGG